MPRLGVIVLVLVLIAGTTAAFAVTERLKLERAPITAPRFDKRFSPTCDCQTSAARLTIRFREPDTVDAAIVDRRSEVVRSLSSNQTVASGDVTFTWDGRSDDGQVAADGKYRLRLHLEESRRTFQIPTVVLVDTKPPRLRGVQVSRTVISPDSDGRNDGLQIVYRAGEKSRPIVLVGEQVVVQGKARLPGRAKVGWNGQVAGQPAEAGEYVLSLRLRDVAGNLSAPSEPISVRVRYIDLVQAELTVARRGVLRFRVATDAVPFAWSLIDGSGIAVLGQEAAPGNGVAVRLPRELAAGRYRLEVSANGYGDSGVVRVTRR